MKSRRRIALYCTVLALFALILGWWLVFFSSLGSVLTERAAEAGAGLAPEQVEAIRSAADASTRMLLYEGAFLIVLLLFGVLLLIRSMRLEVALHRERQNFLSAVTHELKTPIASARLHVESLLLGRVPEPKHDRYLETAREELDRLGEMVDHLLETARTTARPLKAELDLEHLDLAAFVRETTPELIRSQPALEVEVDASSPVAVDGNRAALETILRNLYSNTAKYGGEQPRAHVSVTQVGDRARLSVRDFGPGLQSGQPKRMLDPFVRARDELVRERPGVGLGLYLVAELARAHGGSARVGNAEGNSGFGVEVFFPLGAQQ